MEKRILRSLVTSALYPYAGETDAMVHNGGPDANGAEFPESVAIDTLDVPMAHQMAFSIGFEFALEIASAITQNPGHSPDLESVVEKYRKTVREELARATAA